MRLKEKILDIPRYVLVNRQTIVCFKIVAAEN
jgi:hypothetical protein